MNNNALATFGGGCFWGVEEFYRTMDGVSKTTVGYIGGAVEKPTYEQVCSDKTGHAEVVQVEFDPTVVSYEALLEVFFNNHNPTQLNYQGPDHGTQYRSSVFVHDQDQRAAAQKMIDTLSASGKFSKPIVTTIEDAATFWPAEEYHQQYLAKRGLSSCHI